MLFFLYGENTFRSTEKVKQIKEKFAKEVDNQGYNVINLDGESLTLEKFYEAVKQSGFLSTKRLIIIRKLTKNKKRKDLDKEIIAFLKTQKDDKEENYLVFWEEGNPKRNETLVKTLLGFKYASEFKNFTPAETLSWLENKIKEAGGQIDKTAAKTLIAYLGNDLWQLNNELDKLLAYKNGKTIGLTDVETLAKAKLDDNIFNLTDAVGSRNKKLALKLINEQLEAGLNHLYLLTMIVRQFRILLELKSLAEEFGTYQRAADHSKLHPFIVRKTWPILSFFTLDQLKKIYAKLLVLEEKFKSTGTDPLLLFDKFIAEI